MKRSIVAWFERWRRREAVAVAVPPLCSLPEALPLQEAARVLVFAPHPDDECLGCGGLIAKLVQQGTPVRVVLVTDGSGAGGLPAGSDRVRQAEFRAALDRLGVADHAMLGFPDGALYLDAPLLSAVAAEVVAFGPNWLVGPSAADAHRDHRCVARAVQGAAMSSPTVQAVLEYETWGPLPATHVLDIGEVFDTKMEALGKHVLALAQMDYRSASAGLARYRALLLGRSGPAGAAEAFLLTRRSSDFAWPGAWGRPEGWPEHRSV